MTLLIAGLVVFLGVHSARIFGEGWRTRTLARVGESAWKIAYSLASIAGFLLIIWGYAEARREPVPLWAVPVWARHGAALVTLAAFIMIVAAYVPGNAIKARLRHPMVLGVAVWAVAHLVANHTLADAVLFGAFLAWSVLSYLAARRRDRAARVVYAPGRAGATGATVAIGVVAWMVFAIWGHQALIGVRPLM